MATILRNVANKMNEGIRENRCKVLDYERQRKGLLTSVQNEVMRGIKEEGRTRKGACGLNIKGAK